MKIYNRRHKNVPKGAVYVGRPSQWGNPFTSGNKSQNIEDFREYAEKRICKQPQWLEPLRGKSLVCWCAPKACHGEVLIELSNRPNPHTIDWDAWADENAPENTILDQPSDWERKNL